MKKFIKIISVLMISSVLFACGKKENNLENTAPKEEKKVATINLSEKPLDTFNFQTINIETGEIVKSDEFYNKPYTFVNIWGTFCGPCKKELPDLQKLYENYGDKINFLGVVADTNANMGTNVEEALTILKDSGVKYTNIMPNPTMEKDLSKIAALPTSFFVDEEGNVVGGYIGAYSYDKVAATIDELLR